MWWNKDGPWLYQVFSQLKKSSRIGDSLYKSGISLEKQICFGNWKYQNPELFKQTPWWLLMNPFFPILFSHLNVDLPSKYIIWGRDASLFKTQTLSGSIFIYAVRVFLKMNTLFQYHRVQYINCFIKYLCLRRKKVRCLNKCLRWFCFCILDLKKNFNKCEAHFTT